LVHATNGDVLAGLALAGFGIIVQPAFIVEKDIAAGRLEPVLEGWTMEGLNLYAIYLSRTFLSAKVRLFIDHLRDVVAGRPV
jgi:DNA-binding transcriptional LysR family regulator